MRACCSCREPPVKMGFLSFVQLRWSVNVRMSESTTTTELHSGYPVRKGWYECVVEGVTLPLFLSVCEMKCTKTWLMEDRTPVEEEVKWIRAIDRPIL